MNVYIYICIFGMHILCIAHSAIGSVVDKLYVETFRIMQLILKNGMKYHALTKFKNNI